MFCTFLIALKWDRTTVRPKWNNLVLFSEVMEKYVLTFQTDFVKIKLHLKLVSFILVLYNPSNFIKRASNKQQNV